MILNFSKNSLEKTVPMIMNISGLLTYLMLKFLSAIFALSNELNEDMSRLEIITIDVETTHGKYKSRNFRPTSNEIDEMDQ